MSYLIKRAIVVGLLVFTLLVFTLWIFSPLFSIIEPIGEDCCPPIQAKPEQGKKSISHPPKPPRAADE